MIALLIGLAAAVSTYLGGMLALKFKDKLHLILGFSAGAVLGVAFFDLLPQALALGTDKYGTAHITTFVAVGFILFAILNHWVLMHPHDADDCDSSHHKGALGAGSLAVHSFLDGIGVGLAFQVSAGVGAIVAAAVLAHDFSDGINTVSLIIKNKGSRTSAMKWLLVDAAAPLLGVLVASQIAIPGPTLGVLLAIFCGFFLFIGASDLLPESHHHHTKAPTVLLTLLGMGVVYAAITIAGI
jgi:zinc transporter ZupT